jgi:hypothetical protein
MKNGSAAWASAKDATLFQASGPPKKRTRDIERVDEKRQRGVGLSKGS